LPTKFQERVLRGMHSLAVTGRRLFARCRAGRALSAAPRPAPRCAATLTEADWDPKVFVIVEAKRDEPGVLGSVLDAFSHSGVNLTNLESRHKSFTRDGPSFYIDFEGREGDPTVKKVLDRIRGIQGVYDVRPRPSREVPWFPLNIRDLDLTIDTLDGGTALINEDHPGFMDPTYRRRREEVVSIAKVYRHGEQIPRINYTQNEVNTWGAVYTKLQELSSKWACKEYLEMWPQMEAHCGYAADNIPQLVDISDFLQQRTGFTLRPISGLLSARDFLNALAFRVFYSTQYIRHHGNPLYTPEPDICHELMGHVPLFANAEFADFSQEIGLASLAASDDDVNRLAALYWFTVEFGLLREDGQVKAFGAGLLSSFGEMEWSCAESPSLTCRKMGSMERLVKPEIVPLDPIVASRQAFPITTYQPLYFCADSLKDAKVQIAQFCDSMTRPFFPQYEPLTQNIRVTKAVTRLERVSTAELQAAAQKDFFDKDEEKAAE